MIYALDTNIISFLLRPGRNQEVVQQFEKIIEQGDSYVIPPISYYEITWYLLRKKATAQLRIFERIYQNASTRISMGEADFRMAAKIKANMEEQGFHLAAMMRIYLSQLIALSMTIHWLQIM
ncbi:MAG: PIN domain-containing protein [Clostridiales bacterium]|jgi:predicted nucleic acid-binding protein|nr:PIN domain-containing protein [Clostridiales bacterium]